MRLKKQKLEMIKDEQQMSNTVKIKKNEKLYYELDSRRTMLHAQDKKSL
jgi:hypothetical protein